MTTKRRSAQVGLSGLHYAICTKDDISGVAYQPPVPVPGLISAKITTNSSTETLYADNGPDETASAFGGSEVEINISQLDSPTLAAWLGHEFVNGVVLKGADDTAPYLALGFKSLKANGSQKYIWLYKGKFSLPDEEFKTKGDKPEFQTPVIKGTFIKRKFDGKYQVMGDDDEAEFTVADTWFNGVYPDAGEPVVDTTPPAVPSVSIDATDLTKAVLNWIPVVAADLAGYHVYRGGTKLTNTPISVTTYTDSGLTAATGYTYQVTSIDTNGNESPLSAPVMKPGQGATQPWAGKTANALGDSITAGSTLSTMNDVYWNKVKPLTGLTTVNGYGQSGKSMTYAGTGTDDSISSWGTKMSVFADLLTVLAATNDFRLDRNLGTINDTDNTTFYGAYQKLIADVKARSPHQKIVLMTPTQRNKDGYNTTSTNLAGHKLVEYVDAVLAIGNKHGIPVLDLYNNSGITEANIDQYTNDRLHLNAAGHQIVANLLAQLLQTVTPSTGGGTGDTTAPVAPGTPTLVSKTQTSVTVAWTAATDNVGVTGYEVYRGSTLAATVSGSILQTTISSLTAGTPYSITVKAKDAAGNTSAASAALSVTTEAPVADTTKPTAPTNLAVSGKTATSVSLTWSASTDAVGVTGYDVFDGAAKVASVNGTSATVSGLTPESPHTYTVKGKDAAGNVSDASNAVNVTTDPAGSGPVYVIQDEFETPGALDPAWGGASVQSDWVVENGRAAYKTLTGDFTVREGGKSDGVITASIRQGAPRKPGLTLRYVDSSNYLILRGDPTSGQELRLIKRQGGTATPLKSASISAMTQGTEAEWKVTMNGDTITVDIGEAKAVLTHTLTAAEQDVFKNGTKHGMYASSDNGSSWGYFRME